MTYLVSIAFVAILASLALALFFMLRGSRNGENASPKMARALGLRVGLSIVLFVGILVAWKMGYIHPSGIPPGH
jgi:VIT1/CCC1 family predicted Fe2+/Mn2+ transporter